MVIQISVAIGQCGRAGKADNLSQGGCAEMPMSLAKGPRVVLGQPGEIAEDRATKRIRPPVDFDCDDEVPVIVLERRSIAGSANRSLSEYRGSQDNMITISTTSADDTVVQHLDRGRPRATISQVRPIAPTAAITVLMQSRGSAPLTSGHPSIERPNIIASTASQPIVRSMTARK